MFTRKRSRMKSKKVLLMKELFSVVMLLICSNHIIDSLKISEKTTEEESSELLPSSNKENFYHSNYGNLSSPKKTPATPNVNAFSAAAANSILERGKRGRSIICTNNNSSSKNCPHYHFQQPKKDALHHQQHHLANFENSKHPLAHAIRSKRTTFSSDNQKNEASKEKVKKKLRRRRRVGKRASKTGKILFFLSNPSANIKNSTGTRSKRQLPQLVVALHNQNIDLQDSNNDAIDSSHESSKKSRKILLEQSSNDDDAVHHQQQQQHQTKHNRILLNKTLEHSHSTKEQRGASNGRNDHLEFLSAVSNLTAAVAPAEGINSFDLGFSNLTFNGSEEEEGCHFGEHDLQDSEEFDCGCSCCMNQLSEYEGMNGLLMQQFLGAHPVRLWKSLGFYEDSYLQQVNEHWLQYEPTTDFIHNSLAAFYGVFMVIGCTGNALIILMFFRCRSLRTPPNYLIVNLAVSDFLMLGKTPIFLINSIYRGPALGALGCKIYGFVGGLTGTASIMSLASIALDRYCVIVHPLNPFKRITSQRAILLVVAVWLYSAFFSAIPLFGIWNKYTSEGFLTSCSFDYLNEDLGSRIFVFVFFLAAFVCPMIIILFSYWKIWRMVKAAAKMEIFPGNRPIGNGNDQKGIFRCRQDKEKLRSEMKIAFLASVIIILWVVSWTPYAIVALMGIFGYKEYVTPLVSSIPALLCKMGACLNPFVYFLNHPRFQKELRSKFKMCCVDYQQWKFWKRSNQTQDLENMNGSICTAVTFRLKLEGGGIGAGGEVDDVGGMKEDYACPILTIPGADNGIDGKSVMETESENEIGAKFKKTFAELNNRNESYSSDQAPQQIPELITNMINSWPANANPPLLQLTSYKTYDDFNIGKGKMKSKSANQIKVINENQRNKSSEPTSRHLVSSSKHIKLETKINNGNSVGHEKGKLNLVDLRPQSSGNVLPVEEEERQRTRSLPSVNPSE